jgi:hypothetical protein
MSLNGFHTKTPNANRPAGARNRVLRAEQERRRTEAQARQAAYDAKTPEQRIADLDKAGFRAQRVRAKLAAEIVAREEAKKKPAPVATKENAVVATGKVPKFKKLNEVAKERGQG